MVDYQDYTIPIKDMIALPIRGILAHWSLLEEDRPPEPNLFERRKKILDYLFELIPEASVKTLRDGVSEMNPSACVAINMIAEILGSTCNILLERCKKQKLGNYWRVLRDEVAIVARLADVCERPDDSALAFFLLASAQRALGDNRATVKAYLQSIISAEIVRDMRLLAAAHGNIANVFADLGDFDTAVQHYKIAFDFEQNPSDKQLILSNKAGVLAKLGEWKESLRTYNVSVQQMEVSGIIGSKLAIALDDVAQAINSIGESEIALEMLQRARLLFDSEDLKNRAVNALLEANIYLSAENSLSSSEAFCRALNLALDHARRNIDSKDYEQGFRTARASSLRMTDDAYERMRQGVYAKEHDSPDASLKYYQLAVNRAQEVADHQLALRVKTNIASLFTDLGQVDQAIQILTEIEGEANQRGLALIEGRALGTLASLAASGADIHDDLGSLGPLSRAIVLLEVHASIVESMNFDPNVAAYELGDTGAISNELAKQALHYSANDLAAQYFRQAIIRARALNAPFELANRLSGLLDVLTKSNEAEEAEVIADEIASLLDSETLPASGRIVGHRAMAAYMTCTDRPKAIVHLRVALAVIESIRLEVEPGSARANTDRQVADLPYQLAELLRQEGQDVEAFEALQFAKGRRIVEILSAKSSNNNLVLEPPNFAEVQSLLGLLNGCEPSILIDLASVSDGIVAYIVNGAIVSVVHVVGDLYALKAAERGDIREREARLVSLCLTDPLLHALAEGICAAVPANSRALIVPDRYLLHNLPLHSVPVQGCPWGDRMPMTYLPAIATLRYAKYDLQGSHAFVAGNSRGDLPGATAECEAVGAMLNTEPLLGQSCTRELIEKALRHEQFNIVHLAVHGRGDLRYGVGSSLLLADGQGGTEWVSFDAFTSFSWTVSLVVLSGCSTGVLGFRHGHNLLSVANAAIEAGAGSVLASLWPVDDEYARLFMIAFYDALIQAQTNDTIDLRLVLGEARNSLRKKLRLYEQRTTKRRDGRDLSPNAEEGNGHLVNSLEVRDAIAWSPFALYGMPILKVSRVSRRGL
jgi:tetratricopeptide (TPR) repeat protein